MDKGKGGDHGDGQQYRAGGASIGQDIEEYTYIKPLPLNLQSSLTHLSKLDVTLKSKFDRIQMKNLHHAYDRPKQSFMDPKLSDLHRKIDHAVAVQNNKKKKKQLAKNADGASSAPRSRGKAKVDKEPVAEKDGPNVVDYRSVTGNLERGMDRLKTTYAFRSKMDYLERMSVMESRGRWPQSK